MALALTACPSDDSDDTTSTTSDTDPGTTTDSTTTMDPSTTTMDPSTTTMDPSTTTMDPSTTDGTGGSGGSTGGNADLQECLDNAMGSECTECACNNCLTQTINCEGDEGCLAIRQCARDNMCTGADCLPADVCGNTIDMYGGITGMSAQLANSLSACVNGMCADPCMAMG